jgi:hypothetical protein
LCNNLENASYHIANKEYTKEEYTILKEKLLSKKEEFLSMFSTLDKHIVAAISTNVS